MIEGFEIGVEELKSYMENGKPVFFINLLHHHHHDNSLLQARKALRVPDDAIAQFFEEIPHGCPIVIYGTCQGDETSIRAARVLRQHGWDDVHPLVGGFNAYLDAGLPVEKVGESETATKAMLL